jgi:hypothetical protein
LAADARGTSKTSSILISEYEPADGTRAAAQIRDFGMSRLAARQAGYISRPVRRKGMSVHGTTRTFCDVRLTSAIEPTSDIQQTAPDDRF